MATAKINVCVDEETKKEVEALLDRMGLNMTAAINMYLKRIILEEAIPFEITAYVPNAETLAAFKEAEEMRKHPEKYPSYSSIDELRKALEE
ncbi:MAG: type II toxin-antitoxin system RelB/DinJ family antitoxin [Clostridiales bacterium]|nr:type II toxin-antitoxin system RelB/DinJ family antitoxin [Clostridiales bacterium]